MTTNQKFDAIIDKLDQNMHRIDERMNDHDQKFIDIGSMHAELSHKLDTVIRQTSDLPAMWDNIEYLVVKVAPIENNFKKIDEQFIKMEAKDDYLLERINQLDDRVDKISRREYA